MRGVHIFSGNSHPALAATICERLGTVPATAQLGEFSNGETRVDIGVSVRNQDVYIVQSGSPKINDSVMELLIMIQACKGGSAKSITGIYICHRIFVCYQCFADLLVQLLCRITRIPASPSKRGIEGL